MAGYLRFVQFCQSANISYAFVNASGYSRFSPPTTVCFPGEFITEVLYSRDPMGLQMK